MPKLESQLHLPTLPNKLATIVRHAALLCVRLECIETSCRIILSLISRQSGSRKGNGAHIMESLTQYADQIDKDIEIYVLFGEPKLIAYYERFGFVPDPDEDDQAFMIRTPAAPVPVMKGVAA